VTRASILLALALVGCPGPETTPADAGSDANDTTPAWRVALGLLVLYIVWGTTYLAIKIGVADEDLGAREQIGRLPRQRGVGDPACDGNGALEALERRRTVTHPQRQLSAPRVKPADVLERVRLLGIGEPAGGHRQRLAVAAEHHQRGGEAEGEMHRTARFSSASRRRSS